MKVYLDCIPCIVRHALDAARRMTTDEAIHRRMLHEALLAAAEMDPSLSPPAMAQWVHRRLREQTGETDVYRESKDQFNRLALSLDPLFQSWVDTSDDPMEMAVRLAIAGNVIDFGVKDGLTEEEVRDAITDARTCEFDGPVKQFSAAIHQAERILYLADNAGEIVLDLLLLRQLPPGKVTVAVRGFPILNDALMADAKTAGIHKVAEVIENGSDAPGTILDDCNELFREHFDRADLVIAKGQGNYETLSEVDKEIFFLLKAKCPVVARDLGCPLGALVLKPSNTLIANGAKHGGNGFVGDREGGARETILDAATTSDA